MAIVSTNIHGTTGLTLSRFKSGLVDCVSMCVLSGSELSCEMSFYFGPDSNQLAGRLFLALSTVTKSGQTPPPNWTTSDATLDVTDAFHEAGMHAVVSATAHFEATSFPSIDAGSHTCGEVTVHHLTGLVVKLPNATGYTERDNVAELLDADAVARFEKVQDDIANG